MDSPQQVNLHLRIRVQPGRRADFLAFLRGAIAFYEAPGGITIRLLQDLHDDHRFIEVVLYDDEAVYQRDQQRVADDPAMKAMLTRWRELLAEAPVVEVYRSRALDAADAADPGPARPDDLSGGGMRGRAG